MRRRPPRSTLVPYTTLFRSHLRHRLALGLVQLGGQDLPRVVEGGLDDADHVEGVGVGVGVEQVDGGQREGRQRLVEDRKSTRLNSSHANISYAAFCLKKINT